MKDTRVIRFCAAFLLASLIVFSFPLNTASADDRVVQNDANNPIKFSIDPNIANGAVSTANLYIGTIKSYLGDKADGKTTVFQGGSGTNPNDILIMNDKAGIVLAVGTPDFWGYPGGSIIDAGRIVSVPAGATDLKGATFGPDTVLTVQFLFNGWDAWAPINTGIVYFDLVNYNFITKSIDDITGIPAVKVTRKFLVPYNNSSGVSTPRDLDIVSYYSIAPGKDYAYMFDTVKNNGAGFPSKTGSVINTQNEVSLSNQGGDGIDTKNVAALTASNTYNWVADTNGNPVRQFSTTFITPGQNPGSDGRMHPFAGYTGATGYRELTWADNEYVAGESRLYESYLLMDDQASWQKVYDFWASYKGLSTFSVSGNVTDTNGNPVSYPAVVINRAGVLYGWVMGDANGHYTVNLPNENATLTYTLQVEKTGKAKGALSTAFTSALAPLTVNLQTGSDLVPVTFHFKDQNGNPVWGRIALPASTLPTVAFTGTNFFLADNASDGSVIKGQVTALVAPGAYTATAYGEGFGFYSYTSTTRTYNQIISGNTATDTNPTVVINKVLSAPTGWFGIDDHHHGTRADAFSPPEVVAKAEVTAGLDVLTLDDHEFVMDNCPVYGWAKKVGARGYMPSEEVTASWAHFDIMPQTPASFTRFLDCAQLNPIINTNTTLQGIIDDGHNAETSIGANHPDSGYGLFTADNNNTVPGGMTDDFDGIETQLGTGISPVNQNEDVSFWNAYVTGGTYRGVAITKPHYIYASTDIHNSGTGATSGARRSYVYVPDGIAKSQADFDAFSLEFAQSQAAGHSFISSGVFIVPASGKVYGNTYPTDKSGTFTATFNVSALNNITDIYVFSSTGTGVGTGAFNTVKSLVSRTTYTGPDLSTSKDFTVTLNNIHGKQWVALAAVSSDNKQAFTNPIWINGYDVWDTAPTTPGVPFLSSGDTPNTGSFTLGWDASTDVDDDPITYTLQHKAVGDADFTDVAPALTSTSYAFAAEAEGTWVYRVKASDGVKASDYSAASDAILVDKTPPTVKITCPVDPILGSLAAASWTASDAGSGLATDAKGSVMLDTSAIGTKTATAPTASDNVGWTSVPATCTYRVIYQWTGLFSPVDNPPELNFIQAGSVAPLKFSLSGNQGLAIFASGYPISKPLNCPAGASIHPVGPTVSPGKSSLTYDSLLDQYIYLWKTDKSWTGKCRELVITLVDGKSYSAFFKFTK